MIRSKFSTTVATLLSALLVSLAAAGQNASPRTMKIPDGTPVRLALDETLSSATAQTGDTIHFDVVDDVRVGGIVVIPGGSPAVGHIVNAQPKKRLGRGGKLDFSVDLVKLANGTNLKVRASAAREGRDEEGKVIVGAVLVSPLFALMHGKDVNIPQGTTFTALVDGDTEIPAPGTPAASTAQSASAPAVASLPDPQPNLQSLPDPVAVQGQAAAEGDPATVILKSTPDGADITMDGNYVGSTPSTLRLKPGKHSLMVGKYGFKTWQRNLDVTSDGTITVDANLEQN